MCYSNPTNMKTDTFAYPSKYNGLYSPAIYIQTNGIYKTEADIYEVWLEK